mmetsp:Transcript_12162/g.22785  ORF Transcript_12162/g.22785 Transcript_12162/m.22785 type:complete len:445 (-) Transcript_12162:40-1374(-)
MTQTRGPLSRIIFLSTALIPCFAFSSSNNYNYHSSTIGPNTSTSTSTEQQQPCAPVVSNKQSNLSLLDTDRMKRKILSGKVYQHENFLTEDEIRVLLQDVDGLIQENKMIPSGLSNTNKGTDQNFGRGDRTTCPVTWWLDSLRGLNVVTTSKEKQQSLQQQQQQSQPQPHGTDKRNLELLNSLSEKIQQLRHEVALTLNRPTINDASLAHECYYSRSTEGALLKRHMDERHEETKGPRGWMLPSRRSVSWLIYLSDFDVQGGELRSYVQDGFAWGPERGNMVEVASNRGNLQVGWLDMRMDGTLPVFLDSWYRPPGVREMDHDEMFCILYTIIDGKEVYITKPWVNTMVVESFADFIKMQTLEKGPGLFRNDVYAKNFKLLEDRQLWENGSVPPGSTIKDVKPKRGSLVMFDSVVVPHEVLVVKGGVRTALAGWFHEKTQEIPF